MDIFKIIFLSLFINNVALTQFLGVRPLMSELNTISASLRMGVTISIVIIIVNCINFFIHEYVLIPLKVEFLQTIIYILIIIFAIKLSEFIVKKISRKFYQKSSDYFKVTLNSIVLGVSILIFKDGHSSDFIQFMLYTLAITAGYVMALLIMATITDQNELTGAPEGMKGVPISLITLGILSLAFMGLTGIFK
jgi:electron transport complex protein RnfA